MSRFTLEPRRWYAMDNIFAAGHVHASPILVFEARPGKAGSRTLEVEFWHANYSEGVQKKAYRLCVLRRAEGYLVAERDRSGSGFLVILREVSAEWLDLHRFRAKRRRKDGDLQTEMDRLYLPAGREAIGL